MLKIRLQRVGRKNEPSFRVVVTDSKNGPKSGRSLEVLGSYDPRRGEDAVFDADRILHWASRGAQMSGTIHNLLVNRKIISGKKINVLPKKKPITKDKEPEASKKEEKPKAEEEAVKEEEPKEEPAPAPVEEAQKPQ